MVEKVMRLTLIERVTRTLNCTGSVVCFSLKWRWLLATPAGFSLGGVVIRVDLVAHIHAIPVDWYTDVPTISMSPVLV